MAYNLYQLPVNYPGNINAENFGSIALGVFRQQYARNEVYRKYVQALKVVPDSIGDITAIPFLPISFFKTHEVITGPGDNTPLVFRSSATTSDVQSRHYVKDESLYKRSLLAGFRAAYGEPSRYIILGLLPSYLERQDASLVYMVKTLMECSGHGESGFYLDDFKALAEVLRRAEEANTPVLLIGVTFALLDFAEQYPMLLRNTTIMETGGMKGRRKELTRIEVHEKLRSAFGIPKVHSEYGMTELLSQAYSAGDGIFRPSATMKVLVRDINDPLETTLSGTGCLNIIDLANVHSCAFIATEDTGRVHTDGSFEVTGRLDHSALRGCNLMVL